ncbi:MAG: tRNA lysidine(34) synthetase TilS [Clostridia bacterium]|nr:tRNA lysidine(34) synthetase TilS [Clostridia bacterium]
MGNFTLSLDRGRKYLLGFSGGADSVCLFHLLRTQGYSFSVAHVNHGIRGAEADRDEDFCRTLADMYGIEFHVLRAKIPEIASASGESLEEAARKVRYSFFEDIMREKDIKVLLTAHNSDDNAETLLLSLARGCSPSGACGIAPVRQLNFGEVHRPILSLSKKEIVEFCHENSYAFVTDSTNSDVSYPETA